MPNCKCFLISIACICFFASALNGNAFEYNKDDEDFVDILKAGNKVHAVVSSGKKHTIDLKPSESIQWMDARGFLGAFLTNLRFVVVSNDSDGWQIAPLKLSESENNVPGLSPALALLTTDTRVIAFDAKYNRFVEKQFPLRDDLLAAEIGDHVAVIVTSSRVFAVASGSPGFAQIHLMLNETIEKIKVSSRRVTIRTPDRLLTFVGRNSTWLTHRLN
jgi:hypothetical protein